MTIMLLPNDKAIFFGDDMLTLQESERFTHFVNEFLSNPHNKAAMIPGVKMVIDARHGPAIAIVLPDA